jgi:hypothetical protein
MLGPERILASPHGGPEAPLDAIAHGRIAALLADRQADTGTF